VFLHFLKKFDINNRKGALKHMPAPKGNQFALGNNGPQPSKYTAEFIEQGAVAFIKWFSQPDNIYFNVLPLNEAIRLMN
jgi:hypothetical protein